MTKNRGRFIWELLLLECLKEIIVQVFFLFFVLIPITYSSSAQNKWMIKSREQGKYHISPENQVMYKSCDSHFCQIGLFSSDDLILLTKIERCFLPCKKLYFLHLWKYVIRFASCPLQHGIQNEGAFSLQKHGQSLNVLLLHSS